MTTLLSTQTSKEYSKGVPDPLGITVSSEGVNFALYSRNASEVYLILFDDSGKQATDIIRVEDKTDGIWHVFVRGIKPGQLYGYKVNGEYDPAMGKRFNVNKLLLDPYARAVSGKFMNNGNSLFAYDLGAEGKDLVMNTQENSQDAPKAIVVDDSFDWRDDSSPGIPMPELVIYETHVKGFTAHPSSGVSSPGTYLGFIEKIPYLKELGINAVELMPVQEYYIRKELLDEGLTDFWGYNTIGFFAPESGYGTQSHPGCQVEEFKTMVRELHSAGIEVILDVVYNHTGEGNELGPTLSFKGIDNNAYYSFFQEPEKPEEPYRYYLNDTGCGNTLNIENPVVMRLVLDSLRYWVEVMHVDGFRFDLASILARVKGEFSGDSLFFKKVSEDPVLSKVKMIAEPWDLRTYQVGNFPVGWSEWNGRFRDTTRKFIKGDEAQASEMATCLTGSADLYRDDGRKPYNSINFITCHDGFTMHDLFSYNGKHNEANLEDNRDGSDNNYSWNCGVEGETDDPAVIALRKKMIKNAFCCLLFSSGTPMILYGDEVLRSQKGNNNAYCQDNEITWFNWDDVARNADILDFVKKGISLRKKYSMLRHPHFFTGLKEKDEGMPDIYWFGKHLDAANWHNPKIRTLCYQLALNEHTPQINRYYLFIVINMFHRGTRVDVPVYEGAVWYRLVDTSRKPGDDFRPDNKEKLLRKQDRHYFPARSVSVLVAEHR